MFVCGDFFLCFCVNVMIATLCVWEMTDTKRFEEKPKKWANVSSVLNSLTPTAKRKSVRALRREAVIKKLKSKYFHPKF